MIKWLVGSVVLLILLCAGYLTLALKWSYSDGERAGYLQKFSHKGWVCKTYEGELAMTTVPGVAPTLWKFTVHDATVAEQLNQALGKQIALHYEEHLGVPTTCNGETSYYVTKVQVIGK